MGQSKFGIEQLIQDVMGQKLIGEAYREVEVRQSIQWSQKVQNGEVGVDGASRPEKLPKRGVGRKL